MMPYLSLMADAAEDAQREIHKKINDLAGKYPTLPSLFEKWLASMEKPARGLNGEMINKEPIY